MADLARAQGVGRLVVLSQCGAHADSRSASCGGTARSKRTCRASGSITRCCGRTYTPTGPRAITHQEIAAALSRATGRPIAFHDLPPEHFVTALADARPQWQLQGLVEDDAHYAAAFIRP